MNINLKELFNKDEIIPRIYCQSLSKQLKDYGKLEFKIYKDGGFHFNLIDAKEDIDLSIIKIIIQNHVFLEGYKQDKIEILNTNTKNKILELYPVEVQLSASLGVYGDEFKLKVQQDIMGILSTGNSIKSVIMSKKKVETIDAVDINIK